MKIHISRTIKSKKWKIFRFLSRIQDFPRFMPTVRKCEVLERNNTSVISRWEIEIDDIPLTWKEKAQADPKNFSITFESLEGDFETFKGQWLLKDHPSGGVEISIDLEIELGIPYVEQIVGQALQNKVQKSFEKMLAAIEEILTLRRYKNIAYRSKSDLRGFAVIGHPYNLQHLIRYFRYFKPELKLPSEQFLVKLFEMTPSYKSYDISGFKSKTGKEVGGYFIMCPIIPDMVRANPEQVIKKVIQACKVAEDLGVGIVTLGGFTSIAGEFYSKVLLNEVNVPVTTGNTYTVGLTLAGVRKAALLMGTDLSEARVTIIGGTGDIGGTCAAELVNEVRELILTGRSEKKLMDAERVLSYQSEKRIKTMLDNNAAIKGADIVIAAASSSSSFIDFNNFKPGAIVCDIGYPKNISYTACKRKDILIFSGGLAALPADFNLGFDIGAPSNRVVYGCFAEAILLDLEERYENFSWGKGSISRIKIDYIMEAGEKHGFSLAPFFWGSRQISEEEILQISKSAKAAMG